MGLTSAIAFSWGVLLLIADRQPLERRWVLTPTILVVTLIAAARTWFSVREQVEFSPVLLVFAIALIVVMTYSYVVASRFARCKAVSAPRA